MISELLEVPLWCLECVATRTEAEHVLAICVVGKQLQALLTLAHANIRSCSTVEDALERAALKQSTMPRTSHALIPVSVAVVESLAESRQQLMLAIGDCLEKLQAQQPSLELFVSQHSATADVLESAGCGKEAARRRFLVAVETQMVHNISVLLRQATSIDSSTSSTAQGKDAIQSPPAMNLYGAAPLRNYCKEVWSQLFDGFDAPPLATTTTGATAPATSAGAQNSGSSDDHSHSHLLLPLDRLAQSVRRPPSRQSNLAETPQTPLVRAYAFTSSSSSVAERGPSEQSPWTGSSDKRAVEEGDESQSATPARVQRQVDTRSHTENVDYDGDNDLSGTQPSMKRPRNQGVTLSELFEGTPAATPHAIASQASDHTLLNATQDTTNNEQLQTLVPDDDGPETQPDVEDGGCLVQPTNSQTQDPPLTVSDTSSQDFLISRQPRFVSQSRALDIQSSSSTSAVRQMSRMNTF